MNQGIANPESAFDAGDERIVRETGIDARVAAIVEPVLESMGYRLVRVRLSGQNGMTLQIMAERPDGSMTVEDCEEVSRALSPVLDVEDPVDQAYNLEISSPGIDRPLVRKSDFQSWIGHLAKVETQVLVDDRKRFRGHIESADRSGIVIRRDAASYGDSPQVAIPYGAIAEARLLLTDELVRDALKQDRKLRQQRKKDRRKGAEDANSRKPDTGS